MSDNPIARCPPRRALRVLGIDAARASLLATEVIADASGGATGGYVVLHFRPGPVTLDGGAELSGDSTKPDVSRFGRFVTFENDGGAFTKIFVRDRGPIAGDLNGDGVVDAKDEAIMIQNWGECPCCAADLTGDGWVREDDHDVLLANWGDHTCNWVQSGEE